MAELTVDGLGELISPAANDEIGIWDVSAEQYLRIRRDTLVGGTITGGGTIATGGYTLTVPATGTAALISTGTWTPTLLGDSAAGTQTYNTQVGRYVRIGSLVVARFYVRLFTIGSPTGNTLIGGLPFTSQNNSNDFSGGIISYWGALGTAYVALGAYVVPNTTYAILRGATAAAVGLSAVPVTDWTVNTEFIGLLMYEA